MVRLSLAQFTPQWKDVEQNILTIRQYLQEARGQQSDLVLFPEMSLTGYLLEEDTGLYAEAVEGNTVQSICASCREMGTGAVISFPENDGESYYICTLFIDAEGNIRGHYRKSHLFDEEKRYFKKGKTYPVFDTPYGNIGMMICYDLEFPEVSRLLRLKGADMILISTANMEPYETYQDIYLKSRAMENEIPVIVCNRLGQEGSLAFFGESRAVDNKGDVLLDAGKETGLFTVDIPIGETADEKLNYTANINPDIYRELDEWMKNQEKEGRYDG
ncbi:carbon-nitrogen hydrolase family protein [Salibacterium sp. K-3]